MAMSSMIDWARAEQVAVRVAERQPAPSTPPSTEWDPPIERIEQQIEDVTGLRSAAGTAVGRADRPAHVGPGQHRLVPPAARPGALEAGGRRDRPRGSPARRRSPPGRGRWPAPSSARCSDGWAARVLGQYDLLVRGDAGGRRRRRCRLPRRPEPGDAGAALRLRPDRVPHLGAGPRAHPPRPVHRRAVDARATSPGSSTSCSAPIDPRPEVLLGALRDALQAARRGPPAAARDRPRRADRQPRAARRDRPHRRADVTAGGPRRRDDDPGRRRPRARRRALRPGARRPSGQGQPAEQAAHAPDGDGGQAQPVRRRGAVHRRRRGGRRPAGGRRVLDLAGDAPVDGRDPRPAAVVGRTGRRAA